MKSPQRMTRVGIVVYKHDSPVSTRYLRRHPIKTKPQKELGFWEGIKALFKKL
jgi:hypothetical protein